MAVIWIDDETDTNCRGCDSVLYFDYDEEDGPVKVEGKWYCRQCARKAGDAK